MNQKERLKALDLAEGLFDDEDANNHTSAQTTSWNKPQYKVSNIDDDQDDIESDERLAKLGLKLEQMEFDNDLFDDNFKPIFDYPIVPSSLSRESSSNTRGYNNKTGAASLHLEIAQSMDLILS